LFDGGGLFLLVMPNGSKLWRLKYRFGGEEKLLSFGPLELVSLADARANGSCVRVDLIARRNWCCLIPCNQHWRMMVPIADPNSVH
jgi:hypothetical protein